MLQNIPNNDINHFNPIHTGRAGFTIGEYRKRRAADSVNAVLGDFSSLIEYIQGDTSLTNVLTDNVVKEVLVDFIVILQLYFPNLVNQTRNPKSIKLMIKIKLTDFLLTMPIVKYRLKKKSIVDLSQNFKMAHVALMDIITNIKCKEWDLPVKPKKSHESKSTTIEGIFNKLIPKYCLACALKILNNVEVDWEVLRHPS